jgi:hypothetical protein
MYTETGFRQLAICDSFLDGIIFERLASWPLRIDPTDAIASDREIGYFSQNPVPSDRPSVAPEISGGARQNVPKADLSL